MKERTVLVLDAERRWLCAGLERLAQRAAEALIPTIPTLELWSPVPPYQREAAKVPAPTRILDPDVAKYLNIALAPRARVPLPPLVQRAAGWPMSRRCGGRR